MGRTSVYLFCTLSCYFFLFLSPTHEANATDSKRKVNIGVVLDMGSMVGKTAQMCLDMGITDFYAVHSNFSTRVVLHVKDSGNDALGSASAAMYLIKNLEVQAILGPQKSSQASFVIDLGTRAHVPIVSFTVNSPKISPAKTPYFIRTGSNAKYQVDALAAVIENFGWKSVSLIAEDTEYGAGLIPYLSDAIQGIDARIGSRSMIPSSAAGIEITNELYKLKTMQTQVFVVHMLPPLSSRFFEKVRSVGMMTEGYVWIITEALTDILITSTTSLEYSSKDVIGVLGVRTHVSKPKDQGGKYQLNDTDGLRAYDTAQAIAAAVEADGGANLDFDYQSNPSINDPFSTLGLSKNGPRLREAILATEFQSTAGGGKFHLEDGELAPPSQFEIINIVSTSDRWNRVRLWNKEEGLISCESLHNITWPGGSILEPKGWQIPTAGKVLRVGVPIKGGFLEFVDAANRKDIKGYCVDIFDAAIKALPYSVQYKYIPYNMSQTPGSYDVLVDQVYHKKKFDAVVGDVTIIANRSRFIDFTLPFTESGVSMVVPVKKDGGIDNGWIFLKPLSKELWLGTLTFFFLTGFAVWFIEHRVNTDFRGNRIQQMGTIFHFAFSTMFFAHKEKVVSNFSKLVIIIWMFVVLILTSSYTASLTSMLTVEKLNPTLTDVNELVKNKDYVGYQDGSFVRELLIDKLNFQPSQLRNYTSIDGYLKALSKGSRNGGVSAIIDEIPYIRLLLMGRCKEYRMVGKTYKTGGFGFVFPKHSPLVSDVSNAVLNVTQGGKMKGIESKWFGDHSLCPVESSDIIDSNRLRFDRFWGLFLITGLVSFLSMILFFGKFWYVNSEHLKRSIAAEKSLWGKLSTSLKRFDDKEEEEEEESSSRGMFMNGFGTSPSVTSYDDASHTPSPPLPPESSVHTSI